MIDRLLSKKNFGILCLFAALAGFILDGFIYYPGLLSPDNEVAVTFIASNPMIEAESKSGRPQEGCLFGPRRDRLGYGLKP